MRRFFVQPENISGATALLTGAEARHIATVLRLAPGAVITLFDGSGSYFDARLMRISPARVEAKIISITPYIARSEDPPPALHLGVGLLKGQKMDFIIQKSTELGVSGLYPFRSRFCVPNDPAPGRLARWHKIALEACKQCNRPRPPELHDVTGFHDVLSLVPGSRADLKLIFWEEEGQKTLAQAIGDSKPIDSAFILIGPEGGFSADEVAAAVTAGFRPVTLGSRILRAETAALAAAAILQYRLGNLS